MTERQIEMIKGHPYVQAVHPDTTMSADDQTIPWGVTRVGAEENTRIAGDGYGKVPRSNVYVIDTGIDTSHRDLLVGDHVNFTWEGNQDCNGHGTHVAGIIGALDNSHGVVGVAPGVLLTGVKVLNCFGLGTASSVIAGVDWVTANAVKPAVANVSLGGFANPAVDRAIEASVESGVFYALAAGNFRASACYFSPARIGAGTDNGIMTVGGLNAEDEETFYTNNGPCVDIWAPGQNILSTALGGGLEIRSGTSMAAPHVAGSAALFVSRNILATPAEVEARLRIDQRATSTKSRDGREIFRVYSGLY